MRKYVVAALMTMALVAATAWTTAFAAPGEDSRPCTGPAAAHNKHCEASGHQPGGKDREDATGGYVHPPAPRFHDGDGDGVADGEDNCPTVWNRHQRDHDDDGVGDRCETDDTDGDGVPDGFDNCRTAANLNQADADDDGTGDKCDQSDTDGDGVNDSRDNCAKTWNPDQRDADRDGQGDACDPDADGDGLINQADGIPSDAERAAREGAGTALDTAEATLDTAKGTVQLVRDTAGV